jgi:pyrimidine operon attenuation protein/uracil phosphoribosyltransferase
LLDAPSVARGLNRVAGQMVERHGGVAGLVLVGVRRGGVRVAEELCTSLKRQGGADVPMGTVDITLYRDDASSAMPNPRIGPSEIPGSLQGKRVVLVDDVISTGRTVRAALDAIMDYGRPRSIELAVVIDSGGRELPSQPD